MRLRRRHRRTRAQTDRGVRKVGPLRRAFRVLRNGTLLFAAVILGFTAIHPGLPWGPRSERSPLEWVGVIHVHSEHSDGTGTIDEIAAAGQAEDLDFIVVTDHNVHAFPRPIYEGTTLLIAGEEANTNLGSHMLVVGGDQRRPGDPPNLSVPKDPDGALRITAHPFGPARPWKHYYPASVDGIEVWNADTELRGGDGVFEWATALGLLPLRPMAGMYRLLDRPDAGLALLDSIQDPALRDRFERGEGGLLALVCSVDAHQRIPIGDWDIRFPTYRQSFLFARMHLLLADPPAGDARIDANQVIEAFRSGRGYCAFDGLADARGLTYEVFSGADQSENDAASIGGRRVWAPGATARISLPPAGKRARMRLLRGGEVIDQRDGTAATIPLPGPGIYRLEVELDLPRDGRGWLPWILTNAIVLDEASPEAPEPGLGELPSGAPPP